jgi:hypothetical protein
MCHVEIAGAIVIATTGIAEAGGSESGTVTVALQDLYLKTGYVIGLSLV